MALSLNRVTLIGNVGKDPEIRNTQDGREIASFTLATSEAWKDKSSGERRERTEWHEVVVFSQPLINIIKNYVHKGSKLYVEGALHTRKWTDTSTGTDRKKTEIVIQAYHGSIMLLDAKGGARASEEISKVAANFDDAKAPAFEVEHLDDDIPF